MGLITRQIGPNAKGSKLTFADMDNNLYYLQELGVSGFSYSNGIIEISNPTGGTKDVTINKVTGFTYDNLNTFTITDNYNNNFSATFNTVTGLTVNGTISATTYDNLPPAVFSGGTVTGPTTFTNGLTANTISATTFTSSTVNVGNTTGTPSQAASFDVNGKLVAGLGQSTFTAFGSSTLSVTSSVTTFTLLPGLTQTITVPENCRVLITADGGMNTTSTSPTAISTVDVAIFIDGVSPTNGGYRRVTGFNPSATAINSIGIPWSITTIQNLSAGFHTIDVRSVYVIGSAASVSSNNTNSRQGGLYITIIKN